MTDYTRSFYESQQADSLRSARVVLPVLFAHHRPKSVVDVGCGVGPWLRVCAELGIDEVCGIDGRHVPREALMIPQERFHPADLGERVGMDREFGLAISLEVAEHLPSSRAPAFIGDLTRLSKVVLFSAAIPYQGGTAHINENWPEYWATLFRAFNYDPVDCLRPRLWNNGDVCWWYRQNLIVFAERDFIRGSGLAGACTDLAWPLSVVHPDMFLWAVARQKRIAASRHPQDVALRAAQAANWQQGKAENPPQQRTYGMDFHDDFGRFAFLHRLGQIARRFFR